MTVPNFPKGDSRRLLLLLAAIDELERATLVELVKLTGHNKGVIGTDIEKLVTQFGVKIVKDGPVYKIESWGEILKKAGVKKLLRG